MRHVLPLCLLVLFNLSNSFANKFTVTKNTVKGAVSTLELLNLEGANVHNEIDTILVNHSNLTPARGNTTHLPGSSLSSTNVLTNSLSKHVNTSRIKPTDTSPKIIAENKILVQPTWGLLNGAITNINVSGTFTKLFWLSENRDTVGTNPDLENIGEGKYKLIAL